MGLFSHKFIALFVAVVLGAACVAVLLKSMPAAASAENCGCHPHMATQRFTHKPVKNGECQLCHKSSGQRHPKVKKGAFIFTDNGKAGLCYECHQRKNSMKFVHTPVASGDCTGCHDVHQSSYRYQLREAGGALCLTCHEKAKLDRKFPHAPIAQGRCLACHDPHQSNVRYMLKAEGPDLCMTCHEKTHFTGKSVHPPVAAGECSSCHSTHGTSFPHLLKQSFPEDFYLPFDKGQYALCFNCHDNTLADEARTDTQTNFRNGMLNLHFVHVNKADKGRSCKVCHDPHAAGQPKLISTKIGGFGRWRIPIRYTRTAVGGTCVVGCHKPKSYDRINQFENP